MSMPHCDTRSYPRQYVPVFARPHTSSYRPPMDMRSLLKALMALRDENAYALEERSGVPQATINRFLTGKHGDPRSTTVRKWAGLQAGLARAHGAAPRAPVRDRGQRRKLLQAPPVALRVAMLAAGGDLRAPGNGVPGRVGPFDSGLVGHHLPSCRSAIRSKRSISARIRAPAFTRSRRGVVGFSPAGHGQVLKARRPYPTATSA